MTTRRIDKTDLETIECYYATCAKCGTSTESYENPINAVDEAEILGIQMFRGYLACKDCVDSAIKRGIEND